MLTSVVFATHNLRRGHQSPEDQGLARLAGRAISVPSQNPPVVACSSLTAGFLIANPRLKSALSRNDPSQLQISNRERMPFCHLTPPSRPSGTVPVAPLFSFSFQPQASSLQNPPSGGILIVTPRLESPATPTKQNPNPISNRYKTPFFVPLSRSSPITRHSSRPCPEKAQGRRRVTVAPTSRKAIMCRNHFTQFPRSKPLMRKVTNADSNQS
jgi:hypothetical protein